MDLLSCLDDVVGTDDVQCDSTDWIECINRGLFFVSDLTFEIFIAMELEIHNQLQACQPVNLLLVVTPGAIKSNDDVLLYWSMLSAGWNESSGNTLLDMVINMWICIHGFSYSTAWI